jgi:thiosulfate dehydrogenase
MPDTLLTGLWTGPADWRLTRLDSGERASILYGKELIAHTSGYLGPNGTVRPMSNGMNCQNCHLQAGSQPWGNNYFGVQATYPKFRERSGTLENQVKRINDCFERSLNGRRLDSSGKEMKAILSYIRWIGSDVPKDRVPKGSGIYKLKPLTRPADPEKGKLVYQARCASCHKENGEGLRSPDGSEYSYPPLWGNNSYNTGAGLFRISGFAGYVKLNMPLGTTYQKPLLSDEEAWDVAAFVNSQPRPRMDLSHDWPNLAGKPFDHPFGPYADPFPEEQHKYGPFKPIQDWKKNNKNVKVRNPLISTL